MSTLTTDTCHSLSKFAHATGSDGQRIPWTKLQGSNLFALVRGNSSSLSLRVVQKTTVLESVNVSRLIARSRQVREKAPHASLQQLPIFGITRNAALALQYYLENGQARRVQLNFESMADCRQVVDVLTKCGLECQNQYRECTRPGTTSSLNLPALSEKFARQGTELSQPQSASSSTYPLLSSMNGPPLSSEPPTRILYPVQVRELPSSQQCAGTSKHIRRDLGTQEHTRPPHVFLRDETTAPREPMCPRPITSHFFTRNNTFIVSQDHGIPCADELKRADSATHRSAHELSALLSSDTLPHETDEHSLERRAFGTDTMTPRPHQRTLQESSRKRSFSTCQGTTIAAVMPESLEIPTSFQGIYELPRSDRHDTTWPRPLSSSLTLPPLPKPKVRGTTSSLKTQSSSPHHRAQAGSSSFSSSHLKKALSIATSSGHDLSPPKGLSLSPQAMQHDSGCRKIVKLKVRPCKAVNNSTGQQAYSIDLPSRVSKPDDFFTDHAINTQHLQPPWARLNSRTDNGSATAARELIPSLKDDPVSRESRSKGPDEPSRFETVIVRPESAAPALDTSENGFASLERYALQNAECRQAALDQLFLSHLENPAFLTLCEDVRNNWRRFALGL